MSVFAETGFDRAWREKNQRALCASFVARSCPFTHTDFCSRSRARSGAQGVVQIAGARTESFGASRSPIRPSMGGPSTSKRPVPSPCADGTGTPSHGEKSPGAMTWMDAGARRGEELISSVFFVLVFPLFWVECSVMFEFGLACTPRCELVRRCHSPHPPVSHPPP